MPIRLEYDETKGELKDQRPESWNRNARHVAPARFEVIVLVFTPIRVTLFSSVGRGSQSLCLRFPRDLGH